MSLHTMGDESMSRIIDDFTNPVRVGIVPTGMESIDSRIGGMYRGCTYFVLGAPEIGKLPFVLSIADNITIEHINFVASDALLEIDISIFHSSLLLYCHSHSLPFL